MRPKKLVLLVDRNEERLAVRRFLLTNKGFKVLSAATPEEARAEHPRCDLVVGAWPCSQSLIDLARHYFVPSLVLVDKLTDRATLKLQATQVLSGDNVAPWCIVEAVTGMTTAKPGPKSAGQREFEARLLAESNLRIA